MKPFILCLLAALTIWSGAAPARACQYCALAAGDPEMAKLAAEMHAKSGGFPLDAAVNRFQPTMPTAVLTTPPAAANVATRPTDLAANPLPAATTHRLPPPAITLPAAIAGTASHVSAPTAASRWADGGLLGLLGLAGIFGWRTRRAARAAS